LAGQDFQSLVAEGFQTPGIAAKGENDPGVRSFCIHVHERIFLGF